MNNSKDLCERLNAMLSHRGDGVPTQFINPDGPDAAARIEALKARVAELEGALNERDLFINPEALEEAANEIDCGPDCECIYREHDVNFSMCLKSDKGEYCPNDVAETLRALAKVSPSHLGARA